MSDIFGIAKSGLQAYKESLATTGQNIANVGNENYARREVNLTEVRAASADVLAVSTNTSYGVKVDGITRAFDQFIDLQLQKASSGLSFATSQTLILEKLEQVLRPSDSTVSTKVNDFFASLSTVSQDPSDLAARNISIDAGRALVSSITSVANGINDLRELASDTLYGNITDFNNTVELLAGVQAEILGNSSAKNIPNSLLDQRDGHLKTLSKLADISVEYFQNGSVKVSLGMTGQGQSLIDGLTQRKLSIQTENETANIYLNGNENSFLSKVQIQSGEIAGNLAADVTLTSTKKSLDDLTKALVREFNEVHRFGVDLNSDQGADFFTLDAVEMIKTSPRGSTAQLRVGGNLNEFMGESFVVKYDAKNELWSLSRETGDVLKEFQASTEIDGVLFSIEGRASLGDSFSLKFTNGSSEHLSMEISDGKKIAASSFYSVEPAVTNSSNSTLSIERFDEVREDNLTELSSLFSQQRNAANAINFVNNGALGFLEDVDAISNLTTLKSQALIQFSMPLSDLDANTKLSLTLGTDEHVFSIGNFLSDVSDYREIAEILNEGSLKSDDDSYSFSDLGIFAGGNNNSLSISSAAQSPYSGFQKMNAGTLNNLSGILKPADEGSAKLQIFTREGIQLSGEPLTAEEANQLISKVNGFTNDAEYSARYIAVGSDSNYIGSEISRVTTSGAQTKIISGIGFSDNIKLYSDVGGINLSVNNVADGAVGAIVDVDGIGAADPLRFAGTYTVTATPASGGDDATFSLSVDLSGAVTVSLISAGSGFADGETITIPDADLAGGGGADFTFDVNGVTATADRAAGEYTISPTDYSTSGSGSNATFTVVVDALGAATVNVMNTGSGFSEGDVVTIPGSKLGNATGADLTFEVSLENSFPTSRAEMPSDISIRTDAGRTAEISITQGMMAGQIAEQINSEIGQLGLKALASNRLEIFDLPNGQIQFDLFGKNSEATSIDLVISNNDTEELVSEINSKSLETGIVASVSGTGAILLTETDGNDISLQNFNIGSGNLSARQIDKFGEALQSSPLEIASGHHLISGGQVELLSPSSFELTIGGATETSSASSFDSGFVTKVHNLDENHTEYSFKASSLVDGNLLDADQLTAIASSSSYKVTLSTDNANQNIEAIFTPRVPNEFSSAVISNYLVAEIRGDAPKSRFTGDDFTLSDGFPENGDSIEFKLGEQDYIATLNTSLQYTITGSTVTIDNQSYSFSEALERLVAASTFSLSGPEAGRLNVGFEKNGSSFRLFASAMDGVLSGHALVASSNNSSQQKNAFHISDTSGAEITTGEFDLTQNDQSDFAELVIGSATYSLSFETTGNTITSDPALPAGVTISTESTGTDVAKMKIVIDESFDEKNIRLKATDNSSNFAFITAGSQVLLNGDKFLLSNYENNRITTTSEVSSLADEIVSFEGLSGEDLIIISTGDRKPSVIGDIQANSHELNPREMTAKVSSTVPNIVDIFDTKSGDLLGSRTLSSSNSFIFRGFDWVLDGGVNSGDEFRILTSSERKDDGTNLERMIALSSFAESTGKGGYTERYNSLVTSAGYQMRASEQNLVNAKVAHDIAVDRKSDFSGVDLDTEAANLLEQQQAYQALARVLSTAKELMDTLLRSM